MDTSTGPLRAAQLFDEALRLRLVFNMSTWRCLEKQKRRYMYEGSEGSLDNSNGSASLDLEVMRGSTTAQ